MFHPRSVKDGRIGAHIVRGFGRGVAAGTAAVGGAVDQVGGVGGVCVVAGRAAVEGFGREERGAAAGAGAVGRGDDLVYVELDGVGELLDDHLFRGISNGGG